MDKLSVAGLILTVIALGIAVWQSLEATRQARHLDVIRASLSTRYLGQFPEFVPKIVELLEGASREIVIVCDYPSYSLFSSYPGWLSYESALKMAISKKVSVSISCLDSVRRKELVQEQFRVTDPNSLKWQDAVGIKDRLEEFLGREAPSTNRNELTFSAFQRLIENVHDSALQHSFKGIKFQEITTPLPIFFWIVDGVRGVFSIPSFTQTDREQGFLTSDPKLISALLKIPDLFRVHKRD